MIVGPKLLHDVSRFLWLVIYIILIIAAFYQATKVRVYFTKMYFVKDSSDIQHFLEAEEKYFRAGGEMTITYVSNRDLDYSQLVNQNKLHRLNIALQECIGCAEGWHLEQTLKSWFSDYSNWVSSGYCSLVTPAITPGQLIVLPQPQY